MPLRVILIVSCNNIMRSPMIKKIKVRKIRVKAFIPEARQAKKDVVFTVSPDGELLARMKQENAFDFLLNKGVIDADQHKAASDFYFAWYNGVISLHGKITQTYDTSAGRCHDAHITEFQLHCRENYYNFCSMLEPEARKLLNAFCEGKRAPEIEKEWQLPKSYANSRIRGALDVLAMFRGYKRKIGVKA